MAKIMIVEDSEDQRELIRRFVVRAGHEPLLAENGLEALNLFCEQPESSIDLVVTDIFMPVMNGAQLIDDLRDKQPELKVIAISGGGGLETDDILHAARALGAVATLQKPYNIRDLFGLIFAALGNDA